MADALPIIPGYSRLRLIGRGGSATVFRAHQERLERDVAIKVLRPVSIDDRTRQLFDAERRLLGQLPKHQNIVTVFDSGFSVEGDPYLVMELCPSGSVAALVKAEGPLSLELVVRVGLRVASALDFAHRRGMIHRDVKPENILISDLGEPVLSDFGIASVLDQEGTTTDRAFSPHHVAPEVLRGVAPARSGDLYALGSSIFTLLMGYAPHQKFAGERLQIAQVLQRVSDTSFPIEIPSSIDAPRELRQLLRILLVKDPSRRMSQAIDAIESLRRLEADLGTDRRELPLPTRDIDLTTPPLDQHAYDPDATHIGFSQTPTPPASTTEQPRSQSSLSASLGRLGRSRTEHPRTSESLGEPAAPQIDVDATVVASNKPRERTVLPQQHIPSSEIAAKSKVSTSIRLLLAGVVVSAVGAGIAVRALTKSDGGVRPTADQQDAQDAGIDAGVPDGVGRPRGVLVRSVGSTAVEVSWTGDLDPKIQFEVTILKGGQVNNVIETTASPVVIRDLDLTTWLPCFQVAAIDSGSGSFAESDPVCAESAPQEPGAQP
jgi:serine/threonine protein kinase